MLAKTALLDPNSTDSMVSFPEPTVTAVEYENHLYWASQSHVPLSTHHPCPGKVHHFAENVSLPYMLPMDRNERMKETSMKPCSHPQWLGPLLQQNMPAEQHIQKRRLYPESQYMLDKPTLINPRSDDSTVSFPRFEVTTDECENHLYGDLHSSIPLSTNHLYPHLGDRPIR